MATLIFVPFPGGGSSGPVLQPGQSMVQWTAIRTGNGVISTVDPNTLFSTNQTILLTCIHVDRTTNAVDTGYCERYEVLLFTDAAGLISVPDSKKMFEFERPDGFAVLLFTAPGGVLTITTSGGSVNPGVISYSLFASALAYQHA